MYVNVYVYCIYIYTHVRICFFMSMICACVLVCQQIYMSIYHDLSCLSLSFNLLICLHFFRSYLIFLPPACLLLLSCLILFHPIISYPFQSYPVFLSTNIYHYYIQLMSLSAYRTAPPKLLSPVFPKNFPRLLISPAGNAWRYPPGPLGSCSGGMPNRAHQSGSPQLRSAQTVCPSSLPLCWPNPPASPGEFEGVERAGNGDPKLKTCGVSQNFISKMRIQCQ